MPHNTDEQNAAFKEAWDATNARWKAVMAAEALQYHVTGAIERGEKVAIVEQVAVC